jgi:Holliday junction resolvase RusA-like endonuclease
MEWKFDISPVAASRPRVGRWGAYYSGPYKDFREKAAEKVYEVIGTDRKLLSGPLCITLELYVKRPKKTSRGHPRADLDNYTKAVFDILNGKLWEDDSQIISMYVTKEWAEVGSDGYFVLGINDPK